MPRYIDLQNENIDRIEKTIKGTEGEILISYKKALDDIRDEIAALYGKYSESGKLTLAELSKYNRLESVFNSITDIMKKNGIKVEKLIDKSVKGAYTDGFYSGFYSIDNQLNLHVPFGLINDTAVNDAVLLPVSGLTYIETIRKNYRESLVKIKQTITNGIIRGNSYKTMATEVKDFFDGNAYNALRVIWTETHRTMVQGQLAAYDQAEELGVKSERIWIATLDKRTREDHAMMDMQSANEDNIFILPGGIETEGPGLTGYAEQDINCRCRVIVQVTGYEQTKRRVKDEGIVDILNYQEWYEKYVA